MSAQGGGVGRGPRRRADSGRARTGAACDAGPRPGRPARGSDSGRPIMALLDLLGRRWALRVIWELREQPLAFRALQERCAGMSSSVLNQRLHELRAAGVLEAAPTAIASPTRAGCCSTPTRRSTRGPSGGGSVRGISELCRRRVAAPQVDGAVAGRATIDRAMRTSATALLDGTTAKERRG